MSLSAGNRLAIYPKNTLILFLCIKGDVPCNLEYGQYSLDNARKAEGAKNGDRRHTGQTSQSIEKLPLGKRSGRIQRMV